MTYDDVLSAKENQIAAPAKILLSEFFTNLTHKSFVIVFLLIEKSPHNSSSWNIGN